jgi:hypothetical protein
VAYVSLDVSSNKEESNSHLYVWIRMSSTGPAVQQRQQIMQNRHFISCYMSALSYCCLHSLCLCFLLRFCRYRACTTHPQEQVKHVRHPLPPSLLVYCGTAWL